jgi:two-component system, NtrC family, sensor kinase
MPRRLATKLIVALALIVLVIKAIALYVNLRSQEEQFVQSMTLGADQLSRSITSATWHAMLADRRDNVYEVMRTIAEKQGVEQIRMFNKDGQLMFSTKSDEALHVDKRAEFCAPCHARATPLVDVDVQTRTRTFYNAAGGRSLGMITPIYNEPSCSDAACHAHPASVNVLGVLDLTIDASSIDVEMRSERSRTALLTLFEIGTIGIFLVFFTSRFVEIPISKLIGASKSIAAMQLDSPLKIESSEELEELAHSFEVMRQRLREAMQENAEFTQHLETKVEERTSQLKAAQHKLIQTDRLASLGQLAASVAHEINNPISGVLNLSMLLQRILRKDGIPPGREEEFRRYLGQISAETARVGRIVSDLLAFSRRSKPHAGPADLNAIVRTTISLVSHKLQLAHVEPLLDLDPALPPVRCDSSQIQQVVINLVLNGAEAMKGGGELTVHTSSGDGHVVLTVRDTGSGMPQELIEKIFHPFFTTKEEGKGVGLGLAVVYGIVEAHGGEIDVESTPGEGSTFRVTLPLIPPAGTTGAEEGVLPAP